MKGQGCRKCKIDRQFSNISSFVKKSNEIHNHKYNYLNSIYKSARTKICIICPVHGEFWQTPDNHLRGRGCPKCKTSKGEKQIEQWLKKHKIEFIPQKRFEKCRSKYTLPFDFYLPEYNICIEYDGEQHFDTRSLYYSKSIEYNDKIKSKFCVNNNIKLIRIKFTEFKRINIILEFYMSRLQT